MSKLTLMTLVVALLVCPFTANAFDKVYDLTLEQFENLQLSERGVTLNNFTLGEKTSFMAKGMAKVQVSFSVRNRNNDSSVFTVMIVGMSDNSILWAVDASPLMARVSANKVKVCNGSAYVSPGTVKKTTRVWVRIVGNF